MWAAAAQGINALLSAVHVQAGLQQHHHQHVTPEILCDVFV